MGLFGNKNKTSKGHRTLGASIERDENGVVNVDVRGQTCPGYLLSINKAAGTLESGDKARLIITYPPCGDDVKTWCREKNIEFLGINQEDGAWYIDIQKNTD